MEWRDFSRFVIANIVLILVDLLTHSLWDFPLNDNAETAVLSMGVVVLMAIRERLP